MKILANDGLSNEAISMLNQNNIEIITTKVAQEQLIPFINTNNIDVLIVRNATKIRLNLLLECPTLKVICKGGNKLEKEIELQISASGKELIYAEESTAIAVAEMVFAHLFSGARMLYDANRLMPLEGDTNFESLQKGFASGQELRGRTLGIIGFNSSGKEVAKYATALGIRVLISDSAEENLEITVDFYSGQSVSVTLENVERNVLLAKADYISLHIDEQEDYVISKADFDAMKDGVGIVNCAFGRALNEVDLIAALEEEKVLFAGIDRFEEEPNPAIQVLMHPQISLSPNIARSSIDVQERADLEFINSLLSKI
ncbi:NAD(P)-dependent oxidoreductase [Flavobacterium ardleyense]|uniref:NAD(P)-dependent oxidoreductase n=1 Tax=Flavobacterium ardleyense TaxID=2038737 RepID=UPI00298C34CC|nr:NAD(P)-dependent oxidoreductase [Flavobacterium ardleyense]